MLKTLEWTSKVNFFLAKWACGLFLLSLAVGYIIHNHIVKGCTDGALSYGDCTFRGINVSYEVTMFSWGAIALFILGSFFTLAFLFFGLVAKLYNKFRQSGAAKPRRC